MSHAIGFGARKLAEIERMKKNEHTSPLIATWSSSILAADIDPDQDIFLRRKKGPPYKTTGEVILAVCASALTQAQDHAELAIIRKGKLPKGHKLIKRGKPIARNGWVRK